MLDIKESGRLSLIEGEETGHIFDCILIRPGQGSSGVYTAENLALSLPAFRAGTHVYIDHPTASEEWDRPERSVRDLIGVLHEDATQDEDGAIRAPVRFYPSWAPTIAECFQDVGMSIFGYADGELDADGIVPPLTYIRSVDVVTMAGAGGQLLSILESQREKKSYDTIIKALREGFKPNQGGNVDEKQFATFMEGVRDALKEGFDSLKESLTPEPVEPSAPVEASVVVEDDDEDLKRTEEELFEIATTLAKAGLPEPVEERVKARILAGEDAETAIAAEKEYFAEAKKVAGIRVEESASTDDFKVSFVSVKDVM